ncbi:hypothetical protein GCM10010124_05870 [Pilimelia terevasa]|uniref:L,D-TPase catalytic domain-containing protein n=1 Tax=Pilimelia terevasa TaxID=53372 RepID=A0A8J3BKR3_9ACTN|nr:Ig-like domain-containing protein [Pilimelia terevasa]GGK16080.1 hypothetical protein GCM10010124_05870 [Pilimelia terevasa]
MIHVSRSHAGVVLLAAVAPLALAGCDSVGRSAELAASPSPSLPPLTVAVTAPVARATGVPVSAEIGAKVAGGTVRSVRLVDDKGTVVPGALRPEGPTWVPGAPLAYGREYTAVVTAAADDGRTAQARTTFTTAARRPDAPEQGSGLYLFNGNTYGVAMPVAVEFIPGVPQRDRAAVQRRLFVTSTPAQPGVWHWVGDGSQVFYRPPTYWRPGTKLAVRLGLAGMRLSNGRYAAVDRRATVTIGRKLEMAVDNRTKRMTVRRAGKVVRTMPVSLGKSSTPSSSGTLVVMEKLASTIFDTTDELPPGEAYRTRIAFAQRLTWGGEFIHSAPWSVGDQGYRNVSHGCVNVGPDNASWLFGQTLVGDPVTVRGTERRIGHGNGWTPWNLTWREYVRASALPVPAALRNADRKVEPRNSVHSVDSRM